jgi:hypothetical protein
MDVFQVYKAHILLQISDEGIGHRHHRLWWLLYTYARDIGCAGVQPA